MKLRFLLALAILLSLSTGTAMAQDDPFGVVDTLVLVPTVEPTPGAATSELQLEIYGYVDEGLKGASAGFTWNNSKLQMDSAVASADFATWASIGPFFFENNDLSVTNANQRFLIGGVTIGASLPAQSSRRLWATYYFTATDWTSSDQVVIDTLTFSAGSTYLLSTDDGDVIPAWGGEVLVGNEVTPSNLVVDPGSFAFTATEGGANPAAQALSLTSDGDPLDFNLSNAEAWLNLSSASGTTPASIDVSVDITGLAAGTYDDTITATSPTAANTPIEIPISLTVEAPPESLLVSPDTLYFSGVENGSNPAGQIFNVAASSGGGIAFNAIENAGWFGLSATSGTTPEDITVNVDLAGLSAGDFLDSVIVTSGAAVNSPQKVYVALTVEPEPIDLVVSPDTLYFTGVENGSNPAGQSFNVAASTGAGIAFNAIENAAWFGLSATSGTTPEDITVNVDLAGLADGTYFDSVVVTSGAAVNSPQLVYVLLSVEPEPVELVVTPDTLYFEGIAGGSNPAGQSFNVAASNGGAIPYDAQEDAAWFDLSTTSGTTPEDIDVNVDLTGLTDGIYFDSVLFSSGAAVNSPQLVYVQLTVAPQPFELVVDPDTLYFSVTEDGPVSSGQLIFVSEAFGRALEYTISGANANVLLATNAGTTPDSNLVSVDPTGLAVGDHSFSLSVESAAATNSPQNVMVMVTVNPRVRQLVATPDTLFFTATEADANPADQNFEVTEELGASTLYLISEESPWISVAPGNGTTPSTQTVSIDITGVPAGMYADTILVVGDEELLPVNGDSVVVFLTVEPQPNVPPVLAEIGPKETDEGVQLFFEVSATDPNGTFPTLTTSELPTGANFVDSGNGNGYFMWTPTFEQSGLYEVTFYASDGEFTDSELVVITVNDVAPQCSNMILSDTNFVFHDTVDFTEGPIGFANMEVTSDFEQFCFTVENAADTALPGWLVINPDNACTPANISIGYDGSGLGEGFYQAVLEVVGDSTVCESRFISVSLELVDTTSIPEDVDSVLVGSTAAFAGQSVELPVTIVNQCDIYEFDILLFDTPEYLTLDSITFESSAFADWPLLNGNNGWIETISGYSIYQGDTAAPVPAGTNNAATLHYTIAPDAPGGFYEINLLDWDGEALMTRFNLDCGSGIEYINPVLSGGGIMVGSAPQFVCGYVVDPDGNPIEGASVELWGDFPFDAMPAESDMSDSTGYFEFFDVAFNSFDLWGYKMGYYPGLLEDLSPQNDTVMIVLTPMEDIVETPYFVSFACSTNTWLGAPLPVGSVVDAYDPDGVHCGTQFVESPGVYKYMAVYGDDTLTTPNVDEGAEVGDNIRFFVNGIEARAYGETVWTGELGGRYQACLEAGTYTKACDLVAGWNLVSWPVDTDVDEIESVLSSIAPNIELVLGFEQGGLTYDPDLPIFSTLWEVDHLSGYWIKVDQDVTLEVQGAPVSAMTPIPVTAGWNLVSYLPEFALPTEDALQSLNGNVVAALGFDGAGLIYLPGDTIYSNLDMMAPCNGYWVKVDADDDLIYPGTGPALAPQKRELGSAIAKAAYDITPTNQWMNVYARDLTVDGEIIPAGATVEAYAADGSKIGSATVKQDGLFGFMPVYADDPGTQATEGVANGETFTLSVNGVATEEQFAFAGHGEKLEISNLTAKTGEEPNLPVDFSLAQNYPNPFNPTTTIEFTMPASGHVTIEVFNVLGEQVATIFDGTAESGVNHVEWNATNRNGAKVASGIYFYRLSSDNYTETKKMTLLK